MFNYNMNGFHMGNLTVYTRQQPGGPTTSQWGVWGNHGDVWLEQNLTLSNVQTTGQVPTQISGFKYGWVVRLLKISVKTGKGENERCTPIFLFYYKCVHRVS